MKTLKDKEKYMDVEKDVCIHCGWVHYDNLNDIENSLKYDYDLTYCPNCNFSWEWCDGKTIIGRKANGFKSKDVKEAVLDFNICLIFNRWGIDGINPKDYLYLKEKYNIDFNNFIIEQVFDIIFGDFEK